MKTCLLAFLLAATAAAQLKTENVVLVTLDGVRWQDVFRGMDRTLERRKDAGMEGADGLRARFGGKNSGERRAKLTPFLWGTVAEEGLLLGNRDAGSEVTTRNRMLFSYPGYAELLTGRPHDSVITSNDLRPSPAPTILEIARDELDLDRTEAALFGSWHVFRGIGASRSGRVLINAGRQALDFPGASPRLEELNRAQFEALPAWGEVRHDFFTFEMALEYMRQARPRLLYIALDETDDWAHGKRYDRTLEMIHAADAFLDRLWSAIESSPNYQGKTTLIVAVDHGRGSTPETWTGHGKKIPESEGTWIAAIGPDTKAHGALRGVTGVTQSDVAPTILTLMGVDPAKLGPDAGTPIRLILGQ